MSIIQKTRWMEFANRGSRAAAGGGGGFVVKGAGVHLNATQAIPNGAFTLVSWDTVDFDVNGPFHSGATFTGLTVPAGGAGFYLATSSIVFGANATGQRQISFFKNGSLAVQFGIEADIGPSATLQSALQVSYLFNLVAGDSIAVGVLQTSGGPLNILGTVGGFSTATAFSLANIP